MHFDNEEEITELVRKFESLEFSAAEFKHQHHLVVALYYLTGLGPSEAEARMRSNVIAFATHHGALNKYNETITQFWMRRVHCLATPQGDLAQRANLLLQSCDDSHIIERYYSKELLWSESAKTSWIEPDLKPIDF